MFYEERISGGKFYFRTDPKREWMLISNENLTGKINHLINELYDSDTVNDLADKVSESKSYIEKITV